MTTKDKINTRRRYALGIALSVAASLHLLGLWCIHDMPLPFSGKSSPWSYQERETAIGQLLENRELTRKNVQLAQTFKQFLKEVVGETTSTTDTFDVESVEAPELESVFELAAEAPLPTLDDSTPEGVLETFWNDDLDASTAEALKADMIVVSDQEWAEELLRATEALAGEVDVNAFDPLDNLESLAIGVHDNSSNDGEGLVSSSGLRQHERSADASPQASLLGAQEEGSYRQRLEETRQREQENLSPQLAPVLTQGGPQVLLPGQQQSPSNSQAHVASSNDFDVYIEYAARRDAPGYLFRLTLQPRPEVIFKSIRHNIAFLIDRSHSISKERYYATKAAVASALDMLREGDSFNILVFDDTVSKLAPEYLRVSASTVAQARQFLAAQPHGGLFASTDLYASLGNIIPDIVGEHELNTVILLSDGDTYLSKDKQRQNIGQWSRINGGKVALYSLAVGPKDNLALLDLISSINKGKLNYCAHPSQVCDAISGLLRSLRNPIGKNLTASVVTRHDDTVVNLLHTSHRRPDLYRDAPYSIYGTANNLDDFFLFVQGHYYNSFLDIKQHIAFKGATPARIEELERQYAISQAHELYTAYLAEGNNSYLNQARHLLKPYKIPVAFQ